MIGDAQEQKGNTYRGIAGFPIMFYRCLTGGRRIDITKHVSPRPIVKSEEGAFVTKLLSSQERLAFTEPRHT